MLAAGAHEIEPQSVASIIETIRRLKPGTHDLSFAGLEPIQLSDWPSRCHMAQTLITAWKHLPPAERQAGIKVEDVDQLVDKLKNEAKVIS